MRGPYDFAKHIANGSASWSDVPAHLLEHTKAHYQNLSKAKGSVDDLKAEAPVTEAPVTEAPVTEPQASAWKRLFSALKKPTESLDKAGAMARFPYNPVKDKDPNMDKDLYYWQGEGDKKYRETLPQMEGNARTRALHKLSGKTRVLQTDKGRYFLLHRGMSAKEKEATVNKDEKSVGSGGARSSWTPDYKTALEFQKNYDEDDRAWQNLASPVSAWVHENDIVTIPRQLGQYATPTRDDNGDKQWHQGVRVKGENQYEEEHEVVLSNDHKSHLTSAPAASVTKNRATDLNARISDRGNLDPTKQNNDWDKAKTQVKLESFNQALVAKQAIGELRPESAPALPINVVKFKKTAKTPISEG